jgi:glucose/arabinose dehydrogenase
MKDLPMRISRLTFLCTAIATLGLAGCSEFGGAVGGDPMRQIGANPYLPEPQQYLLPPMHIATAIGWSEGETPSVPQGMQVHALATGLEHPRFVYVLPNGDVLVVEANGPKAPINRPKDLIMGWVQNYAGTKAKGGNRITLLRDIGPDGVAKTRTVFLDHLNSPYGIALVGHDFMSQIPMP